MSINKRNKQQKLASIIHNKAVLSDNHQTKYVISVNNTEPMKMLL